MKTLTETSWLYFTALPDSDGLFRPAYTMTSSFNPNKRIKYWYSRAGADNKAFFNVKRASASGKLLATNVEMNNVPEVICHGVYYYMMCRYNVYELHWVLNNCLEMIEGSNLYEHEKAVAYENMKCSALPSDDGTMEQPTGISEEVGHQQ